MRVSEGGSTHTCNPPTHCMFWCDVDLIQINKITYFNLPSLLSVTARGIDNSDLTQVDKQVHQSTTYPLDIYN